MAAPSVIKRAADVVFQTLARQEGAVLLHLGTGQYHTLNPLGTRIWELLEQPRSEPELSLQLEAEFEADIATIARDVRLFLAELSQRDLIQWSSER